MLAKIKRNIQKYNESVNSFLKVKLTFIKIHIATQSDNLYTFAEHYRLCLCSRDISLATNH